MSQERWDVVVRFTTGPLAFQPEHVCRGPVVRLGANPGPGGVVLAGYRGLNARHAVITSYDGGTVAIAPVGTAQVRVGDHEHVDWNESQAITGPVYLSENCAVHLGPVGRGVTLVFITARRLGVWEQHQILSEASQADPSLQPTQVKQISTQRGIPTWFIGGTVMVGFITASAVLGSLIARHQRAIEPIGPQVEGEAVYHFADMKMEVNVELREGLDQPFYDFVMAYNIEAAGDPRLGKDRKLWDQVLIDQITRAYKGQAGAWAFYRRLESVTDEYASVLEALRKAGLPEVFAGIPYQESGYTPRALSPACALGWWQFMPESGKHFGLQVANCRIAGREGLWNPTLSAPPRNIKNNADYIRGERCMIQGCAQDERVLLAPATDAAVKYLSEPLNDPVLRASGAVVQLAITAFNAGYDDSRYGIAKARNVLPAYQSYLKEKNLERAPDFLGINVTCNKPPEMFSDDSCGSKLAQQSQHYAYNIIAQHLIAVCYYGQNHDDMAAFQKYRAYARQGGYCARTQVPTIEQVRKK